MSAQTFDRLDKAKTPAAPRQRQGNEMRSIRLEAGAFAFLSSAAAAFAEATHAPPDLVWLLSASAGTLMGAFASTMAYSNIGHEQRVVRLIVSFCAGLLAAPYAAAHLPRPDAVPLALHVFSVSGLCAFVAWTFVRAAQRRLAGIAESALDKVAPRANRKDDQSGRVRIVHLVLLAGLAAIAWLLRDVFVLLWLLLTTQVH